MHAQHGQHGAGSVARRGAPSASRLSAWFIAIWLFMKLPPPSSTKMICRGGGGRQGYA